MKKKSYEFEPDEDEIFEDLLPKNISTQIFKAFWKMQQVNKVLE